MATRLTRVTVNLVPPAVAALHKAVEREEIHQTDIVNRALQVYNTIGEFTADGSKLAIHHPDGTVETIHII